MVVTEAALKGDSSGAIMDPLCEPPQPLRIGCKAAL
jgi:hypothetical protein